MPRQRFTGTFRTLFADLQHGVNALVHRASGATAPAPRGSTVVLSPGDELETVAAYVHPQLEHVADEISEAAAMLPGAARDVEQQLADALKAERSAAGDVLAQVAAAGAHDVTLPSSNLVDPTKTNAADMPADPELLNAAVTTNLGEHAAVATPVNAPGNVPAPVVEAAPPVPAAEQPAAPVEQPAPVVEAPAPAEQPAAPVVEAPAAEAPAAS